MNKVSSNKYKKPTIKKYLYSSIRSNFLRVDVDEMAIAVVIYQYNNLETLVYLQHNG